MKMAFDLFAVAMSFILSFALGAAILAQVVVTVIGVYRLYHPKKNVGTP